PPPTILYQLAVIPVAPTSTSPPAVATAIGCAASNHSTFTCKSSSSKNPFSIAINKGAELVSFNIPISIDAVSVSSSVDSSSPFSSADSASSLLSPQAANTNINANIVVNRKSNFFFILYTLCYKILLFLLEQ